MYSQKLNPQIKKDFLLVMLLPCLYLKLHEPKFIACIASPRLW